MFSKGGGDGLRGNDMLLIAETRASVGVHGSLGVHYMALSVTGPRG